MYNNQNTTEVVIENILNTEEINTLTIVGEFKTVVETTIEITDHDKFMSLFPNSEFDEDYFITLLTEGKLKDRRMFSIVEQEIQEESIKNYVDVYDLYLN